jgi:hypothetical protein
LRQFYGENLHMVEIGSYAGESTVMFANVARRIDAVDPWQCDFDPNDPCAHAAYSDVELAFTACTAMYPHIVKHKATSAEAVHHFANGSLDFVYIDGLHTYEGVREDIALWLPKIRPGGCIGGHDYRVYGICAAWTKGVSRAVDEALGTPTLIFPDASWVWMSQATAQEHDVLIRNWQRRLRFLCALALPGLLWQYNYARQFNRVRRLVLSDEQWRSLRSKNKKNPLQKP